MKRQQVIERICISRIGSLTCSEAVYIAENVRGAELSCLERGWVESLVGRQLGRTAFTPEFWIEEAEQILRHCEQRGVRILFYHDYGYPQMLREIYDPPFALYLRGGRIDIPVNLPVAVVGTRNASRPALSASYRLGSEAADAGVPLISGLAKGIDSAAHQGCVDRKGITWAVLGSGVDHIYPSGSIRLAERILECGGALISEFPPLTGPRRWHFPKRNRIISGLSGSVVVVEAPRRSGALITVDFALDQGRDVCTLDLPAEGNLMLKQEGAPVIERLHQLPGFRITQTE
jgi:DNA processing protein